MGRSRKFRLEAGDRWPDLRQFFGCYFHQDWLSESGTPDTAIDLAISLENLEQKKKIARQWWTWNSKVGWQSDPRRAINDGLGAYIYFESPEDARQLMNTVYDKFIVAIRKEEEGWKP